MEENSPSYKLLKTATIDDPEETRQLIADLEASLPIGVRITEQGMKGIQKEGGKMEVSPDGVYQVEEILYTADMGGILCAITIKEAKVRALMSLTHLKIDSEHPLAERVQNYQRKRIVMLAVQNSGKRSDSKPKKKKKGFGNWL